MMMTKKKILRPLFLFLLLSTSLGAKTIGTLNFFEKYEDGLAAAAKSQKLLVIEFYTDW